MPFPFLCVQFNFGEVELWQYNGLYVSALRCFRSTVFQTTRVATSEFRLSDVDYAEFVRAKWMWTRKPESFQGDGLSVYLEEKTRFGL